MRRSAFSFDGKHWSLLKFEETKATQEGKSDKISIEVSKMKKEFLRRIAERGGNETGTAN